MFQVLPVLVKSIITPTDKTDLAGTCDESSIGTNQLHLVVHGGGGGGNCGDVGWRGGTSVTVTHLLDIYGGVNTSGLAKHTAFKIG